MKSVLFVDDHEVLARLSCEILEMNGYRAVSVYNAADALKKMEREKFDILVTDWKMEGMDGLELARAARARNAELPVILVTGYGCPIDTGEDVAACLPKDRLFPALLQKIRLFLGEPEQETVPSEAPVRIA
jgi:CheY-like chemotaxis protein